MTDLTHPTGPKKSSKKMIIIGIAAIVVVALIAFGVAFFLNKDKNKTSTEKDSSPGASMVNGYTLRYPTSWQELQVSAAERSDGTALKLRHDTTGGTFVWRILNGEVEKDLDIKKLPDEVVTTFKKKLNDFTVTKKGVIKVGAYDAAEIMYEQKDSKKNEMYENRMIILPREKTTYYFTFTVKKGQYDAIKGDATTILNSVTSYVESHP